MRVVRQLWLRLSVEHDGRRTERTLRPHHGLVDQRPDDLITTIGIEQRCLAAHVGFIVTGPFVHHQTPDPVTRGRNHATTLQPEIGQGRRVGLSELHGDTEMHVAEDVGLVQHASSVEPLRCQQHVDTGASPLLRQP